MNIISGLRHLILKPAESNSENEDSPDQPKHTTLNDKLDFNHIAKQFDNSLDIINREMYVNGVRYLYFEELVDQNMVNQFIQQLKDQEADDVEAFIKNSDLEEIYSNKEAVIEVLNGNCVVDHGGKVYYLSVSDGETRSIQESETESVILGPHEAFIESSKVNLSLIRKKIKSSHLKAVKLTVGEVTKTNVILVYLEDIVQPTLVQDLKDRIADVEVTGVLDTNILIQLIDDNPFSPFPQYFTTERPDVVASKLLGGKVIGLVDESPYAFCAPVSFFDFFQSVDDYSQRWLTGTFIRLLRYFALLITISFTAIYVSVTTFHYEMIPQPLLASLLESRSKVPFPPLIEALFLEIVIELLREAGARLPTKIGQTIGIVGGIVIGQAAVEAGITSNILIIAVAVSAISSFVIPNYTMSASIRILRFSLILLAGFWGNIGLVFGIGLFIVHITGLTTLKTPYFIPVSPTFFSDWLDSLVRAPYMYVKNRPHETNTKNDDVNKMKK
ncbi:spore germination protein [Bacillus weihaiensis]|uniref:Spore gernimation protein GerA n=1 Tax=Bacillus weihaiensis TaxID=1547283 RepID=A0A1L3MNS0_9BACI|nr:spore germination protein [Bacillus weihaiensis]APH03932.1 spore gernimation protein GerA [Bacillus weihaiensis]